MTVLNIEQLAALVVIVGALYVLSRVIYNIYFHPLANFPGPKYATVSNVFYGFGWAGGRWPFTLDELHKEYGPVVRFAPNDLSFATAQSYQDIHGHVKQGKKPFLKTAQYSAAPEPAVGIASERDPVKHREIRRNLAHAFSAKALRTQTDVILHYVNIFVEQVKKFGNAPEGLDTDKIYNWLTFDIIGDLSFGEPFGSVEQAETHPWVHTIKQVVISQLYYDIFNRLPWLKLCPSIIRPRGITKFRADMIELTNDLVARRRARGNHRDDFLAHLLSEKATNLTSDFLRAQASTLVIAGSETTATLLAGVSYYLLKNPSTFQRLVQEVRTSFSHADQIDGDTTLKLPYLFGVIEEGLRIFPPAPAGMPRTCPGAEIDGHYVPEGVSVSTAGWTIGHTELYFHDAHGFHPERWLPADHCWYDPKFKNDLKEASRPFLIGPRACLGINLAYMEMRMILARMVWEFDWELLSHDVDWNRDISLKFLWYKPALRVRFSPVVRK